MKISKEVKVAILAIVAIVVLYFGFMFLKGSDLFSDTNTYYVVYDDVDGLTTSNPVMLNGIRVGTVQEMTLLPDQENQIRVQIEVLKELAIGDSTIAALGNSDLLGGKAITLYPGNSTTLFDGGERLIAYKESSITDIISSKTVPVIDRVDTTLARVNRILESEAKDNVQDILANVRATTEAINQMLRANQQSINRITDNTAELTASLQQTQRYIDQLALNLVQITDAVEPEEINKLIANANDAVAELEAATTKLNAGEGSLGRLLNDEGLYENLNRSTRSLDLLLRDFQTNPKRYVNFSVFGRKDKYKVDETGRVVTLEEVKEMQDQNPQEFRTVPDTVYVPVPVERGTGPGASVKPAKADSVKSN